MGKLSKFIVIILVFAIFAIGISIFTAPRMSSVRAADTTPTPVPTPVTYSLSISTVSSSGSYVGVYLGLDPKPLNRISTGNKNTYTYYSGTVVKITANNPTPSPGMVYDVVTFSRWDGDVKTSSNPISVTMDGNKNLTAIYNVSHHSLYSPTPTPQTPRPTATPTPPATPTPTIPAYVNLTVGGAVCDSITYAGITGSVVNMDGVTVTTNPGTGNYTVTKTYPYGSYANFIVTAPGYQTQYLSVLVPANGNLGIYFYMVSLTAPTPTPPGKLVSLLASQYPAGTTEYDITPGPGTAITVKLYDKETGIGLPGRTINWTCPVSNLGLSGTSITNSDGIATIMGMVPYDAGIDIHSTITATFNGDDTYNGYSIIMNVHVFSSGFPTPIPTPTMTITPTPTRVPTRTPTPRRTPTTRPTPTIRSTPTVRPTATPTPTAVPTATTVVTAIPTATPVPGGNIKVQLYNQTTAATSNQIYPNIKLLNTGTNAINLVNVKIRYYYTIDGDKSQNFYCDYSPIGSSNVTGTFVTMTTPKTGADTYLEIGFTSGAGSLAAGGNITIQCRFAKSDWSNYTQTNDFSFNTSATTYVDWTKVTGYVSGALQWGTEP